MLDTITLLIIFPLLAPLGIGLTRKIKALMQNRRGAAITQPYYDLWKLFHKNELLPQDASWIFRFAPYVIFAISLLLPAAVPVFAGAAAPVVSDFLVIIYLLALQTFSLALAGIDAGSAFGGFGASREMTLAAFTEGNIVFSILPLALMAHSTNIINMSGAIAGLSSTGYIPAVIAFLGFFIALMSETGRIPFDNPATHLELTMIHEAMVLEYSGKRLALIEWANANKLLFFAALGANLFFPWSVAMPGLAGFGLALLVALLKTTVLLGVVAVIEGSLAKLRLLKLPDLLMTGFIFCVVALVMGGI